MLLITFKHNNYSYIQIKCMRQRTHALFAKLGPIVDRRDMRTFAADLRPKREFVVSIRMGEFQTFLYTQFVARLMHSGLTKNFLFLGYQNLLRLWNHPGGSVLQTLADERKEAMKQAKEVIKQAKGSIKQAKEPIKQVRQQVGRQSSGGGGARVIAEISEENLRNALSLVHQVFLEDGDRLAREQHLDIKKFNSMLQNLGVAANKRRRDDDDDDDDSFIVNSDEESEFIDDDSADEDEDGDEDDSASSDDDQDDDTHDATEDENEDEGGLAGTVTAGISNTMHIDDDDDDDIDARGYKMLTVSGGEVFWGDDQDDDEVRTSVPPDWWRIAGAQPSRAVELLTSKDFIHLGNKFVAFLSLLALSVNKNDKMLLFTQSLVTLDLFEKILAMEDWGDMVGVTPSRPGITFSGWKRDRNFLRIDGSTSSIERQKLINRFNNPNKSSLKLFLLSTKATNVGINLQAANRVGPK